MSANSIRVAIVEDGDEVRQGVGYLIDSAEGFECRLLFPSAENALPVLMDVEVDVVLMDIGLPGMSGIELTRRLKTKRPEMQVMMLTVYEDDARIFESLEAGATGYVLKKTPPGELLVAIQTLAQGGSSISGSIARRIVDRFRKPAVATEIATLTKREHELLDLVVRGFRYREIAERLHISLETVRTHVRHIYDKLQVRSRSEATYKILGPGG